MKSIAVYCASSATLAPVYHSAAAALGREIVAAGVSLVCGGGRTGLMGEVANAVLATGVVALPGGIGTFEELLEAITWRQLGLFGGNIAIYNVEGYYDPLISMLETSIERGFMRPDHRDLYRVVSTAREAVEYALATPAATAFSPKF